MKMVLKYLAMATIAGTLFLSACAPKPPEITKDQLTVSEDEALKAEKEATELRNERKQLEQDLKQKQAELESLKEYEKQLDAE